MDQLRNADIFVLKINPGPLTQWHLKFWAVKHKYQKWNHLPLQIYWLMDKQICRVLTLQATSQVYEAILQVFRTCKFLLTNRQCASPCGCSTICSKITVASLQRRSMPFKVDLIPSRKIIKTDWCKGSITSESMRKTKRFCSLTGDSTLKKGSSWYISAQAASIIKDLIHIFFGVAIRLERSHMQRCLR